MPYQSSAGRAVEESYDDSSSTGRLLPSGGPDANVNVGAPNSARGDGTTTAELVAKLRFLNCAACLFVLLFHTLRLLLNPVRLALLVAAPVRLILEVLVGLLALSLFLVEARVPVLGEKVLIVTSKLSVGRFQCIDLDVARGRAIAVSMMGASLVLINYLALAPSSSASGKNAAEEPAIPPVNATNATDSSGSEEASGSDNGNTFGSGLLVFVQCIVFSPSIWIVFGLLGYTLYVMQNFPEYAESRAYDVQDRSNTAAEAATDGPTWASNVGNFARGSGYQTVGS